MMNESYSFQLSILIFLQIEKDLNKSQPRERYYIDMVFFLGSLFESILLCDSIQGATLFAEAL